MATVSGSIDASASGASGAGGPRLSVGQNWGPYRIGRLLGRGGMGEVYEAESLETGRRLALKLLRSRLEKADDRARFLREGQLASRIRQAWLSFTDLTSSLFAFFASWR